MKNFEKISAYKALMIDIDDTLYDYQKAHLLAIDGVFNEMSYLIENFDRNDFKNKYRRFRKDVTAKHAGSGASRSRLLAFQALFESVGLRRPYSLALDCEEEYWGQVIENINPLSQVVELVKKFHLLGKPICAVTDMQARIQIKKIRKLELENEITHLVTSEEVGFEKPNPKIFQLALAKLNLKADEVVMIGDNYEKDIKGAKTIGMDAWLVKDKLLQEVSC